MPGSGMGENGAMVVGASRVGLSAGEAEGAFSVGTGVGSDETSTAGLATGFSVGSATGASVGSATGASGESVTGASEGATGASGGSSPGESAVGGGATGDSEGELIFRYQT